MDWITQARADAIEYWLRGHRNVRRPLTAAVPLLVCLCFHHLAQEPTPSNDEIKNWIRQHLGLTTSLGGIYGAIRNAIALNELQDHRIMGQRYLTPHQELLDAYLRKYRL